MNTALATASEARRQADLDAPAQQTVSRLIMGFRATQLVYVAAKLDLARHLAERPQTAEDLACKTGAYPRSLNRLLRALASLGLVARSSRRTFSLLPAGRCLLPGAVGSLRDMALLYGAPWYWRVYGAMLHSIETGEPAFRHVHGASLYDYLESHPDAASTFHAAMRGFSASETTAILAAYDFLGLDRFIDVGGGEGALMAALLASYPNATGIVLDLPSAAPKAERLFAANGLAGRASFLAGDFFQAVPKGGDLIILKSILHNWADAEAVTILKACRAALAPSARLLVIERVISEGDGPSEAKLFDINMLVALGGQERTETEHRDLLSQAGLVFRRAIPTASPLSLIEAACPD